jgi:hypothetical protein
MATKKKAKPAKKAAPKKAAPKKAAPGAKNKFSRSALTGLRQGAAGLAKASKKAQSKKMFTKEEVEAIQALVKESRAKCDEILAVVAVGPDVPDIIVTSDN